MKQNRIIALLLAAAFAVSICCSGCTQKPAVLTTEAPAGDTTPEPTEAPESLPLRMQNGGDLSFLPEEPISIPKLSEMVYTRPDTETLIAEYEALTEKAASCSDADELLNDYYEIAVNTHNFESMCELAYFHYCMDIDDSYYAGEYDFCDERYAVITEKRDALFAAFAASPCRSALENAYFGEGFFNDYDDFNAADDTYFELKQQENDLLFEYYDMLASADFSDYYNIRQSHEAFGNQFIELVKVRQQIAAAKGFDNYMDYSYACDYKRDYSTAQAWEYLELIKTHLAPLMNQEISTDYSYWNESKSLEMLSSAAEHMGGPIWEAFRFMSGYELYDVSYINSKMNIGYTDYIANYEAPIIFIDPSGRDLLTTLFHEYGHFTDAYCNYGFSGNYEIAETYSQAMQYLAFAYADSFSDTDRAKNLRATLSNLLVYSILREAAFGEFELRVYSLAPNELTIENLDEIYGQCIEDYGLSNVDDLSTRKIFWSAYSHFYSYQGYVISYSVSAVASLQICRLEAEEPGAGVAAFCRLLDRTRGKKFIAVLEEAGLDSPFEAAAIEEIAEFLSEALAAG